MPCAVPSRERRSGNTAALIAHGVRECTWSSEPASTERNAWHVVGSAPGSDGRLFRLQLDLFPRARLVVAAEYADFYLISVPEIGEVPPDHSSECSEKIGSGTASWSSWGSPLHVTSIGSSG